MVFNRKDLNRTFSPSKAKVHARKRLSNGSKHMPSTNGGTSTSVQSDAESPNTQANVRVIIRVRPPNERECGENQRNIVKVVDDKMLIFDPKQEANPFFFQGVEQKRRDLLKKQNKEMQFIFDNVFDVTSTNLDVFEGSTKNIISHVLDGYNCSVFVYGATGAGKTHTMLGKDGDPGLTYLTMAELFRQMDLYASEREFNLGVSYLEVYNENVHDLLCKSGPLHIREDGKCSIIVAGLKIISIKDADELLGHLARGNKNRTQHPTDANAESSRSHAVFQVYVNITNKLDGQVKRVKLSMIDLAGSERASATGCKGARFTEGASINKSLLALGNCINNLADGLSYIPYRDSKLTRLLKDSLGGNCHTLMIANVSPSNLSYEDTYNTLRYANRAKKIKTNVKRNIVSCQMHVTGYIKMVEEQKKEIAMLKQKLLAYENKTGGKIFSPRTAVVAGKPLQEEDLSEWNQKISNLYEKKIFFTARILGLESSDKVLCYRMEYKRKASARLRSLTSGIDAPDLEISEMHDTSGTKRVEKSKQYFEKQRSSIKLMMESAWNELQLIETELKNLNSEIATKKLEKKLANKLAICEMELKNCTTMQQSEHTEKICNLHESEICSLSSMVHLIGGTVQKFYNMMHGYGTLTDPIKADFKRFIRTLEGVKGIKWSDDRLTNDEQHLQDLRRLSIEYLLDPIKYDSPPPPAVCLEETRNSPSSVKMNSTFVAAVPDADVDTVTMSNATVTCEDNEETSMKADSDEDDESVECSGINVERLNNTLNLMESKAKKRVLTDKNNVAGKPTINKRTKQVETKPLTKAVSIIQKNNVTGKENKTVFKSVMSAKSKAILDKMKAERRNLNPVLSAPLAPQPNTASQSISAKTGKEKEKRGLLTTTHPYNRPQDRQKPNTTSQPSRVPC